MAQKFSREHAEQVSVQHLEIAWKRLLDILLQLITRTVLARSRTHHIVQVSETERFDLLK